MRGEKHFARSERRIGRIMRPTAAQSAAKLSQESSFTAFLKLSYDAKLEEIVSPHRIVRGLDVDAVKTVAQGVRAYHNEENALLIITHNAKILEGLKVDFVHVLDDARIVRTGDGSLVNEIIEEGFHALKEDEAK